MNEIEGAASSWVSLRSATFLMLANFADFPVVNSACVSGQLKD